MQAYRLSSIVRVGFWHNGFFADFYFTMHTWRQIPVGRPESQLGGNWDEALPSTPLRAPNRRQTFKSPLVAWQESASQAAKGRRSLLPLEDGGGRHVDASFVNIPEAEGIDSPQALTAAIAGLRATVARGRKLVKHAVSAESRQWHIFAGEHPRKRLTCHWCGSRAKKAHKHKEIPRKSPT